MSVNSDLSKACLCDPNEVMLIHRYQRLASHPSNYYAYR